MARPVMCLLFGAVVCLVNAAPVISTVQVDSQSAKKVKVDYTLSEEAIVTVEFLNDGESIGSQHVQTLSGNVNARVAAGVRSLVWNARADWPDRTVEKLSVRLTAWPLDMPPWFMAVKIGGTASDIRYYADKSSIPGGIEDVRYKTDYLLFRRIPAAGRTVRLGSLPGSVGREAGDVEKTHYASFAHDYYIGVYEVTQAQYGKVRMSNGGMYENPSHFNQNEYPLNDDAGWLRPVEKVSYINLRGYNSWPHKRLPEGGYWISRLESQIGVSSVFDLPTEAQWEYACSGGEKDEPDVYKVAWFKDNSGEVTHPVGMKESNRFDLYDMLGNVLEWCLDFSNPDYALNGLVQFEPEGPSVKYNYGIESEAHRVIRGGNFSNEASKVRTRSRAHLHYNKNIYGQGFRLTAKGSVSW